MLHLRFHSFLLLITLALAACSVGPDFEIPEAPDVESYTEDELSEKTVATAGEGGDAQYFIEGKDIPGCWWRLFHSQPLNYLLVSA